MKRSTPLIAVMLMAVASCTTAGDTAEDTSMSFFITSDGPGNGADLGGLEGADQHCEMLAARAGADDKTWRAYLSAAGDGESPVHARDRIGSGPWYNADGVMVAQSVADLHSENNNLTKETVLTEQGEMVNGRSDDPNRHDIITGSNLDGTLFADDGPATCDDWTSSGEQGSARVGHHDRTGGGDNPSSWNSAHSSRGCGQENLESTGGAGYFYCFATDE